MKYLITYRCTQAPEVETWGMDITDDPMLWLENVQRYRNEIYILVNALEISDEYAEKYRGAFRGM